MLSTIALIYADILDADCADSILRVYREVINESLDYLTPIEYIEIHYLNNKFCY
jgi:hypothetical protein